LDFGVGSVETLMEPGGAVVVLPPPVAAPAPAPAAALAARAAARVPWSPLRARLALATALFVLGCAAAALAFFAVTTTLPRADDSRLLVRASLASSTRY
jgi:hypothetical protein